MTLSNLEFTLEENNTTLDITLQDTATTIGGRAITIFDDIGTPMAHRDKIQFKNMLTTDDGIDRTIVKVEVLTNEELEDLLK